MRMQPRVQISHTVQARWRVTKHKHCWSISPKKFTVWDLNNRAPRFTILLATGNKRIIITALLERHAQQCQLKEREQTNMNKVV